MTAPVMIGSVPNTVPGFSGPAVPVGGALVPGFTGSGLPGGGVLVPLPGRDGHGIELAGTVEKYADLPKGLTAASAGKGYIVKSDGLGYFWSGNSWPTSGEGIRITGDRGAPGEKGLDGRGIVGITVADTALAFEMSSGASPIKVTVPALEAAKASADSAHASTRAADQAAASAGQANKAAADAQTWANKAESTLSAGVVPATAAKAGAVKLPGDAPGVLGGTSDRPTVTGWDIKADKAIADAKYTRPPAGIPASDLAEGVNAALTLANTAVQLDGRGHIPDALIPAVALTEWLGIARTDAEMLAFKGQRGDWCTRADRGTDWQLISDKATDLASWREHSYPRSPVQTVNGRTGDVSTGSTDITDASAVGRKLLTALNETAARSLLNVNPANMVGRVEGADAKGARTLRVWVGTEEQFKAITSPDANTLYFRM